MDIKPSRVATIVGDTEIDHAIATLVLAFGTDPVARWIVREKQAEVAAVFEQTEH
jgi:hypothetical protein